MKYTSYLIKCEYVNVENIVKDNPNYMKPITIPMSIIGAVGTICMTCSMIPLTYTVDTFRNVRYQYLKNSRKQTKSNTI